MMRRKLFAQVLWSLPSPVGYTIRITRFKKKVFFGMKKKTIIPIWYLPVQKIKK